MAKNDPCWDGYKQVGWKMKNGKKVPNCVPTDNALVYKTAERVLSTREQARIIRREALALLEKANEFSSTSRRVSKRAAYKVISRSLSSTRDLPFSIRKHQAISELSNYISLAKHNKVNGLTAFNTDLLPVSHPRSTKETTMTAAAIRQAQMRWVIDDPRITDENAKALIASAMMSHPDSPEHIYTMKRIELLPQGIVPLEALVAAYGDGNSRAAKSARADLQRRDRKGRFAEMFGTFKLLLGLRDGGKASVTGRILGQNIFSSDLLDMELPDGRIAAVPTSQGEQPEAFLDDTSDEARRTGYVRAADVDTDPNAPVVPEDNMVFMDAPSGFRQDKDHRGPGKKFTDEAFDVTVFDNPSPQTRDLIDAAIKRSRDMDLDDPVQIKKGEDGKLWDPDRKLFAVNKRGEKTQFAFAQTWNDALEQIARKEKLDPTQEQFEKTEEEEDIPLSEKLKGAPKKAKEKKKAEKPKATAAGFNYNIPERSLELDPNFNYIPEGDQDDPSMLASMQQPDDLQDALIDALEPVGKNNPATGLGRLEDENGDEFEVPAEAILSAIGEQGGDPEMALAKAYDTLNNNNDNEKALTEARSKERKEKAAEPKELDEVFDEVVSTEDEGAGEEVVSAEETDALAGEEQVDSREDAIDGLDRIPALSGLSREEKESIVDNNGDYSPFIPANENIDFPEGMYKPQETSDADKQEALRLAKNNFSDVALMEGLQKAVSGDGTSPVLRLDENNEFVPEQLSAEVWRDALALKGGDANKALRDIANGTLDLAKEEKAAKSKEQKRIKDAQKKREKQTNDIRKALGINKDDGLWNEYDILQPMQRAFDKYGDDPNYKDDLESLLESYKSFLDGKDLDKYDDAQAALEEFKEAVDSTTAEDEQYKNLVETVSKAIDDSLDSIARWREINPEAGGDKPKNEVTDKRPDTLPEGWEAGDDDTGTLMVHKETGDVIDRVDREGVEPHWFIATGVGESPDFDTAEDALKYWNDNFKDVERVYPEGTPAGGLDGEEEKTPEEILESEKEEESGTPPTIPPAETPEVAEEEPKKVITYKRAGNLTLLRQGKGKPFSDKEIADFLAENGFEFVETITTKDGEKRSVMAQRATQTDEEFKAFARELRDRFNIDIKPRAATAKSPAQEPIDIDAPAPEKAPEPESEVEPTPEVTPTPEEAPTPTPTPETEEAPEVEPTPEAEPTPEEKPEAAPETTDPWQFDPEREKWFSPKRDWVFVEDSKGKGTWKLTAEGRKKSPEDRENIPSGSPLTKPKEEEKPTPTPAPAPAPAPAPEKKPTRVKTRRELIDEYKYRKELLLRILFNEFGPGFFDRRSKNYRQVREFAFELDQLDIEELEELGRLINTELGFEFFKKLGFKNFNKDKKRDAVEGEPTPEAPLPIDLTKEVFVDGRNSQVRPDQSIMIQEDRIYGFDGRYIGKIPEGMSREEFLNKYFEIALGKEGPAEEVALDIKKPVFFDARNEKVNENQKLIINDNKVFDIDRKFIREIPEGMSEDEFLDEYYYRAERTDRDAKTIADAITATNRMFEPEKATTEAPVETEDKPKPIKTKVKGSALKPGDVTVKDHFTITNVEGGYTKRVKGQDVPASRITGYYPGSVEQSSKLWADDTEFDVYRNVEPPAKGDLPELRQPRREDFVGDPAGFEEARAKYDEELERRKATWNAPDVAETPKAAIVSDIPKNLQPNDIAFVEDKNTKKIGEFFVIVEVLPGTQDYVRPDNGEVEKKTIVRGFYPGHQIQEVDWNEDASISVIRGESPENMPKPGDKDPIDRIKNGTLKGAEYAKKRAEIVALRREASKDYKPSVEPEIVVTREPSRPVRPAFLGSAQELAKLGDGAAIAKALEGKRVVVFDFESIGNGEFNYDDPEAPIQIAGIIFENGKKVDEINLVMNPGVPLDKYYYENEDKNGKLDEAKLLEYEGQRVDDEFLAKQPSIKEQLQKFADFVGKDAIWIAQNAEFDSKMFEIWAKKLGVDFEMPGIIDTKAISKSNGNKANSLKALIKKYKIEVNSEDLHDALVDATVLKQVLDKLLLDMKPNNIEFDLKARADLYEAQMERYRKEMEVWNAQEIKAKSNLDESGTDDKPENYIHKSVFGDEINEAWIMEDENAYDVNGGGPVIVDELRVGDFIAGKAGMVEVIDIQNDPENSEKLIVVRRNLFDGQVYTDREQPSSTPGKGWARGRVLVGPVRRRSSLKGLSASEINAVLPKPEINDPTPKIVESEKPVKGEEVSDAQATSVVSDAIETITSGSKSGKKVKEAIKDLNIDESIKSKVLDREGGSPLHLDVNGNPIKVGDRVRNVKNGRIGTVKAFISEFGPRKYKNYLKVKFDDAVKRENASSNSLEIITPDDGDGILEPTPTPEMGMSLPDQQPTRQGLVATRVDPTDIKVGDRLDVAGKTRVSAVRVNENDVLVATKTRGSGTGGVASFDKNEKVRVWRKPEDLPVNSESLGMAIPQAGSDMYSMAPISEEEPAVPNALPEDNYEYTGEKFPPTPEQRNVITAIMTGDDVVVRALAGTGKTSTLTLAARRLLAEKPDAKIVYVAFNKTVQLEAQGKMPKNVESRTGDSIAFQGVSEDIRQKFLNQKSKNATMKLRAEDISDELGIKATGVKLKGVEINLSTREIPAYIKEAVNNFAISGDEIIGEKHFSSDLDEVPRSFVEYANAYWDDLQSPRGVFGINNAHITKIWALSNPDLGSTGSGLKTPANVIFFDEAQDINPVIAKVIADQKIQKVYVGDGNQAIYAFRGAEDQLDKTTAKWDLPLTQSFRFGPEIAGMANRFLAQLDSKYRVEGAGSKGEVVTGMEDANVVITRTNSGGFRAMIELLEAGKTVGITKGTKDELESLVASAQWLISSPENREKFKKPTMHPDLAEFQNWDEVKEAVEKGEGRKVKALYDLVVQNGIGPIKDILGRVKVITPESEKKELKPSSDFKKVTLDQAEDGAKGSIGNGINYEVKDKAIRLSGNGTFKGKDTIKEQRFRWDPAGKQWYKEVEDDLDRQKAINDLRRAIGGFAPDAGEEEDEIDVVVTTAHKSKGLQWDNVRIFDDFWGPRTNKKTGELEMPVDEELRLAYVALTRAQKKLDPGPLNWIKDYTEDEDELPKKPTSVEQNLGMALPTEKVTEEEFNETTVKEAEKLNEETERVANAIIAALEKGTAPWRQPWSGGGFLPTSVASGNPYRGQNLLLLWAIQQANGWTDNRWLTYKEATDRGGYIKKGEKGTKIVFWQQRFKEVEKPDGTTEKVPVFTRPKVFTVFNVEQTENVKIDPIVKGEPVEVTEAETLILDTYTDRPEVINVSQNQAFYSRELDVIKLPLREQFSNPSDYLETLIHELAHSTGHSSRLNRSDLMDNYGTHKESRGEEELIAEITVAIIAGRLGINIDFENVAAYNQSWLQVLKNDKAMIVKAAKAAQKAADHILKTQFKNEEEEQTEESPVGEGVGSEGRTGEEIAEEAKTQPESTPEPNVGEQGRTGEEIAAETGVASIKGEYQKGIPNSGDLRDGMKYEIEMYEKALSSGRTDGSIYGIRRMVVSGNTFPNRQELKEAGFSYQSSTKTWVKSYLDKVFKVDALTQDLLDNNPDSYLTRDLERFSQPASNDERTV